MVDDKPMTVGDLRAFIKELPDEMIIKRYDDTLSLDIRSIEIIEEGSPSDIWAWENGSGYKGKYPYLLIA